MLASLAVADIFMGVYCIPMYALSYIPSTEHLIKDSGKYACLAWFASIELSAAGSLKNLLFLSVDRFIAVIYPLSYHRIMTMRNTYVLVVAIWVYVVVMALVPFLGWNNYDPEIQDANKRCNYYLTLPEGYVIWASFFTIAISIAIPLALNMKIYYTVLKQQRSIRSVQHLWTPAQIKKFNDRMQSVRVTGVLCLLFILFWLPYMLVAPLKYTNLSPKEIEIIKVVSQLFNFLNAVINAPIYALMRNEYKMAYYLLLTTPVCKWKRLKYHSLEIPENAPWKSHRAEARGSGGADISSSAAPSEAEPRASTRGSHNHVAVSTEPSPSVTQHSTFKASESPELSESGEQYMTSDGVSGDVMTTVDTVPSSTQRLSAKGSGRSATSRENHQGSSPALLGNAVVSIEIIPDTPIPDISPEDTSPLSRAIYDEARNGDPESVPGSVAEILKEGPINGQQERKNTRVACLNHGKLTDKTMQGNGSAFRFASSCTKSLCSETSSSHNAKDLDKHSHSTLSNSDPEFLGYNDDIPRNQPCPTGKEKHRPNNDTKSHEACRIVEKMDGIELAMEHVVPTELVVDEHGNSTAHFSNTTKKPTEYKSGAEHHGVDACSSSKTTGHNVCSTMTDKHNGRVSSQTETHKSPDKNILSLKWSSSGNHRETCGDVGSGLKSDRFKAKLTSSSTGSAEPAKPTKPRPFSFFLRRGQRGTSAPTLSRDRNGDSRGCNGALRYSKTFSESDVQTGSPKQVKHIQVSVIGLSGVEISRL